MEKIHNLRDQATDEMQKIHYQIGISAPNLVPIRKFNLILGEIPFEGKIEGQFIGCYLGAYTWDLCFKKEKLAQIDKYVKEKLATMYRKKEIRGGMCGRHCAPIPA